MAANPPLTDPVEDAIRRWRALGRGYLTFALTEPGLFRTAYCRSDHDTAGTFVFRMARPYLLLSAVLNDLIEDQERDDAVRQLATLLVTDGTLFLDIREATAARRRADGRPQTKRATLDDGTILDFTWRPTWAADLLLVTEWYELARPDGRRTVHEYEFRMRPWRPSEIREQLQAHGFEHVDIRAGLGRRTPDRLFVMAQRT